MLDVNKYNDSWKEVDFFRPHREEVTVRVVEGGDGGFPDEFCVEDLGDEQVGAPIHIHSGSNHHARRPLSNKLNLDWTRPVLRRRQLSL